MSDPLCYTLTLQGPPCHLPSELDSLHSALNQKNLCVNLHVNINLLPVYSAIAAI